MKGTPLVLLLLVSLSSPGQTINTGRLDSFFNSLENRSLAMGSLAISQNGEILYQRALGFSYMDDSVKIPATIPEKNELQIKETDNVYTLKRVK